VHLESAKLTPAQFARAVVPRGTTAVVSDPHELANVAGLDAVRDYSFGNIFVDAARQARTPQGPNLGPAITMDAAGNPQADFMTIFISGFVNQAHLYNGTYHGSFTGQADLNTWLTPGGQIQNKVYNAATKLWVPGAN